MIRSAFISIITLLRREDTALTSLLTPLAQPSNFEAAFASLLPPSSPKEEEEEEEDEEEKKETKIQSSFQPLKARGGVE